MVLCLISPQWTRVNIYVEALTGWFQPFFLGFRWSGSSVHETVWTILCCVQRKVYDGGSGEEERSWDSQSWGWMQWFSWNIQGSKTEESQQVQDGFRGKLNKSLKAKFIDAQ